MVGVAVGWLVVGLSRARTAPPTHAWFALPATPPLSHTHAHNHTHTRTHTRADAHTLVCCCRFKKDPILDSGGGVNPVAGVVVKAMLAGSTTEPKAPYSLDNYLAEVVRSCAPSVKRQLQFVLDARIVLLYVVHSVAWCVCACVFVRVCVVPSCVWCHRRCPS